MLYISPVAGFFFNDTATTEIYTLALHDALPIYIFEELIRKFNEALDENPGEHFTPREVIRLMANLLVIDDLDRKSTRLNSSHANISYAVFCLKKKDHQSTLMKYGPAITANREMF